MELQQLLQDFGPTVVLDEKIGEVWKWDGSAKFYFALDSLHSLYCFWEYEDGLWRHHPKLHIASFLFQDLQFQRDYILSKVITKSIRRYLSKEVTNNDKDVFSSKYLSISPITKMAAHQGGDFFESHACSGHRMTKSVYPERD